MRAHTADNQDIYVFSAGRTSAMGEVSSFNGLPIIMEAIAQDNRRQAQGLIDRAVAADDGLVYDTAAQTLTFQRWQAVIRYRRARRRPHKHNVGNVCRVGGRGYGLPQCDGAVDV